MLSTSSLKYSVCCSPWETRQRQFLETSPGPEGCIMFFFSLTLALLDQGPVIQSPDFIILPLKKKNVLRTKNFKGGREDLWKRG